MNNTSYSRPLNRTIQPANAHNNGRAMMSVDGGWPLGQYGDGASRYKDHRNAVMFHLAVSMHVSVCVTWCPSRCVSSVQPRGATGANSLILESTSLTLRHPRGHLTLHHPHHHPMNDMATMPLTIDHTAYPYIIDLIVDNSDVDALLRLGATSKAFHARTTALLYAHVLLADQCIYGGEPVTAESRLTIMPPPHYMSAHKINFADDDKFPPHFLPFVPQAVKVLTVDITAFQYDDLTIGGGFDKLREFTNVTAVRRFGRNTVEWIGEVPFGAPDMLCIDYLLSDGDYPNKPYCIKCISGVTDHIVHLEWCPGNDFNVEYYFDNTQSLERVTFVLWPTGLHDNDHPVRPPCPELWDPIQSLDDFMQRGGQLTIVGTDKLRLWQITDDPIPDDDLDHCLLDPAEKLLRNFLQKISLVWIHITDEEIDEVMNRVQCLTLQEWQSPLSPSEFKLFGRRMGPMS